MFNKLKQDELKHIQNPQSSHLFKTQWPTFKSHFTYKIQHYLIKFTNKDILFYSFTPLQSPMSLKILRDNVSHKNVLSFESPKLSIDMEFKCKCFIYKINRIFYGNCQSSIITNRFFMTNFISCLWFYDMQICLYLLTQILVLNIHHK